MCIFIRRFRVSIRVSGIRGFGFGDGFPPESVSGSGSYFDFGFRFWVHGDFTRCEPDPLTSILARPLLSTRDSVSPPGTRCRAGSTVLGATHQRDDCPAEARPCQQFAQQFAAPVHRFSTEAYAGGSRYRLRGLGTRQGPTAIVEAFNAGWSLDPELRGVVDLFYLPRRCMLSTPFDIYSWLGALEAWTRSLKRN